MAEAEYGIDFLERDPVTYTWNSKLEISDAVYRWKFLHTRNNQPVPCIHKGGCMIIPKERTKPETGWPRNDTFLVYGQPKIGKSTLVSQFPDPLHIDLEDGTSQIEGYIVKPKSLDELREVLDELFNGEVKRFKTIVIDTIDVVYEWFEKEVCEYLSKKFKMNIENIGEGPQGADWAEARKRFIGFVEAWKGLGVNIVFVAHAKSVMGEKGTLLDKSKTIDLPGKLAHRFPAKVDSIAFCYAVKETENGKRVVNRRISFQPYEDLEAGSRRKELQGKDLEMSFSAIYQCFNGTEKPKSVAQTDKKKRR